MRKPAVLFLTGLLCVALSHTAWAQRYERYERMPPPQGAGAPPPQHAIYAQPYFFAHLGLFEPNDSSEGLEGFDTGGSFDVGLGSRVSPNFALEGTFGFYGTDTSGVDVTVAPLTFGVRLIVPAGIMEPYIGGGLGLYFANVDGGVLDDSDTTFGGYGAIGLDAWLTPRVALNFEGKYHWAEPELEGFDVEVGGWTLGMGVRLSF